MATYEAWLTDDAGNKLALLDTFASLDYAIVVGEIGWARIDMPYDANALYEQRAPDRQLHIYRSGDDQIKQLMGIWFMRRWRNPVDATGTPITQISGPGLTHLVDRRIGAYYSGTAQVQVNGTADDLMKEAVRDNLGSDSNTDYDGNAITTRDITGIGFSIQGDNSAGPTIRKAFAWQRLLSLLQALQSASRQEGTEVFFGVVPTSSSSYEFQTWTGQPGQDRTLSGTNPLRFGFQFDNVLNPVVTDDFANEKNFVYAGGQGTEASRNIQEVSNDSAIGQSRFGRIEMFASATNVIAGSANEDEQVQAVGNARLSENRSFTAFTATIQDTPQAPFGGNGWNIGDKITVSYLGRQFDSIIRSVHVRVDANGEHATAGVESVE